MDLVEVVKDEILCDSQMVARKFNQKHKEVVKRIQFLLKELRGVSNPPKISMERREYRGKTFDAYLMDRRFFSLLSMRFKGKKALEWQMKFNDAFYEMESHILKSELNKTNDGFTKVRNQSKQIRHNETDVIKSFIEYATEQGSKSAKFYYKHFTVATYKALDLIVLKKPKVRDTLNICELSELILAERLAQKSIKKYMELNRNYKDIYNSVKEDLIKFGNGLKLGFK